MYDVAIIGAGICGTAIARELSRYDMSVIMIEKANDVAMGATKANSGIVHGGYAESHNTLKGRMCYQGRRQFATLDAELHFGFRETGSLVITFDDDLSVLQKILDNGRLNGCDDLEIIGRDRIFELEPNLDPDVQHALYCRGAGVCSPYEMAIALAENAVANGAELLLNSELEAIDRADEGFELHLQCRRVINECAEQQEACVEEKTIRARRVINAAGIDSARVSAMAGQDYFQIAPRSGEYLLLARGTGEVLNTVVFQQPTKMGKGILVTSTYHGNLLLGPDARDESGFASTDTHLDRLKHIVHEARRTTDKFDLKQCIRSFTGMRAVSSTGDFIIEETATPGFINVAGIQSPGLTSSPAIAAMVRDILAGSGLPLAPRAGFNPERRPIITRAELQPFARIKDRIDMPSGPERIVCRCEQVTEGVIADAMSRGIPVQTIDAVKRRTRAGMGFCQGTFCRPRVKEVVERLGGFVIDERDDVTHSGINRVSKDGFKELLGGE